jgi:tripartite-type tricarboxylate transporter receptor subunit TctC
MSLFLVHPGHAQPYPARPVKIIVPTVAGGTVDVITRLLANDLSSRLGASFFVDNRSGAGNTLGSREAARSDPDGYTLLMSSASGPAGLQDHRLRPDQELRADRPRRGRFDHSRGQPGASLQVAAGARRLRQGQSG